MDTNINIIFSNQTAGGTPTEPECPGATPNPQAPEQNNTSGKESGKSKALVTALAVTVAKQSIANVTSRIGAITRSTIAQQRVNSAMRMSGYAISIGTSLATQNWGAAIMSFISMGVDTITGVVDYRRERQIEQTGLSIAQSRAGTNRSR